MSNLAKQPFDYDGLEEETRELVMHKTHEIHGLMRRTAEEIILIGENLLLVQKHLPETKFSAWLRTEFDLSRQSAYNFMRVASKLGGSYKTVLQLPAKVLYELASSSEAIIEQVETGQLSPTHEAIREAKEAERQAREAERKAHTDVGYTQARLLSLQEEVEVQQNIIDQLSQKLEDVEQQRDERIISTVDMKDMENPALSPEIKAQLAALEHQLESIIQQRDTLSRQVAELQELAQTNSLNHAEADQVRRTQLNWYRITNEFQRSVRTLLSQWPSPLDVVMFEADDWTRLSQMKELARRLLDECSALAGGAEKMIIESDSAASEDQNFTSK